MKITRQDVAYVAGLAHLSLPEEELNRLQKELDSILTYVDQLNRLDTSNVEPMAQVLYPAPPDVALRSDEPGSCVPRAEVTQAAPDATDTFFRVPKVIDR